MQRNSETCFGKGRPRSRRSHGAVSWLTTPAERYPSWSLTPIIGLFLAFAVAGCATVPKKKFESAVSANRELHDRVERLEQDLQAAERSQLAVEDEANRLRDRIAAHEESSEIYKARIENLQRENDAIDARLTGLVMTAAGMKGGPPKIARVSNSVSISSYELPPQIVAKLAEFSKRHPGVTFETANQAVIRIQSSSTFESTSDRLRPDIKPVLEELAGILNSAPAASLNLMIIGYTSTADRDSILERPELASLYPTDWHLAAHQAIAVEQFLEEKGVSGERSSVGSFASFQPLIEGRTETAHKANARVEIFLLAPDPPAEFER